MPNGLHRFYHGMRWGVPLPGGPVEHEENSDDEVDEGWRLQQVEQSIRARHDVAPPQAELMTMWNAHMHHAPPVVSDRMQPAVCRRFANANAVVLAGSLRQARQRLHVACRGRHVCARPCVRTAMHRHGKRSGPQLWTARWPAAHGDPTSARRCGGSAGEIGWLLAGGGKASDGVSLRGFEHRGLLRDPAECSRVRARCAAALSVPSAQEHAHTTLARQHDGTARSCVIL